MGSSVSIPIAVILNKTLRLSAHLALKLEAAGDNQKISVLTALGSATRPTLKVRVRVL